MDGMGISILNDGDVAPAIAFHAASVIAHTAGNSSYSVSVAASTCDANRRSCLVTWHRCDRVAGLREAICC